LQFHTTKKQPTSILTTDKQLFILNGLSSYLSEHLGSSTKTL